VGVELGRDVGEEVGEEVGREAVGEGEVGEAVGDSEDVCWLDTVVAHLEHLHIAAPAM
jgi:hypothetical protein